jgi:hypothetical protein
MTDLNEHFSENLSSMAICGIFVIFFRMFLPFCLRLTKLEGGSEGVILPQITLYVVIPSLALKEVESKEIHHHRQSR